MQQKMKNLFLGLDVSKGYVDAVITDEKGTVIKSTETFYDTPIGHSKLSVFIKSVITDTTILYAGVESTGGYENNWYSKLADMSKTLNIKYTRLNPRAVSNAAKALLTRTVTDEVSAIIIAEYLRRYRDKVNFNEQDNFSSIRRLWSSYELLHKAHTAQWLHLQAILYDANPVILKYTRDDLPNWVLEVLMKYPTANSLSSARVSTLKKIPYVTALRARELIDAAKESIASDDAECTEFLIMQYATSLQAQEKILKATVSKLQLESENIPDVKLLTSIPCIGVITAVGLVINIGDVNRFSSAKKLVSYFGIHPVFKESGDKKTVSRMSKMGRKRPRKMLFMAVLSGVRTNPILNEVHREAQSRGKAPKASLGICMHKLLRIVYGILKSGTPFDVEIHNKHKMISKPKTSIIKVDITQLIDYSDAPISAKEAKRLKDMKVRFQDEQSHQVRNHQPSIQ